MGLPLPVLPIRVHEALGFGSFFVGLALGAQSWITLCRGTPRGRDRISGDRATR